MRAKICHVTYIIDNIGARGLACYHEIRIRRGKAKRTRKGGYERDGDDHESWAAGQKTLANAFCRRSSGGRDPANHVASSGSSSSEARPDTAAGTGDAKQSRDR